MQLILEIKAHQTPEREDRCVKACLDLVKATGMEKQVDYISFSMHACEELVKLNPQARVYYLGSDVAPKVIKQKDYRIVYNQGMGAFNAARMRGIPAELLIFPDENHWVLKPQNGVLWQRTFFSWLDRWLK